MGAFRLTDPGMLTLAGVGVTPGMEKIADRRSEGEEAPWKHEVTPTAPPVVDEHDGAPADGTREDQDALDGELRRLRDLVDNGCVEEARVLVKEMELQWPESAPVQHFARVLAPSRLLSRRPTTGRNRDQQFA